MDTKYRMSKSMDIHSALVGIVGKERVSNSPEELYIYSRDSGAQLPRSADGVVMPKTVEEVRDIVLLANKTKTPLVPLGGGSGSSLGWRSRYFGDVNENRNTQTL